MKRRTILISIFATLLVGVTVLFATEGVAVVKKAPVVKKLPLKGNTKSKIYHKPSCVYYNSKYTTVEFKTEAEAKKAGYTPCKKCFGKKKKDSKKPAAKKTETPVKKEPAKKST